MRPRTRVTTLCMCVRTCASIEPVCASLCACCHVSMHAQKCDVAPRAFAAAAAAAAAVAVVAAVRLVQHGRTWCMLLRTRTCTRWLPADSGRGATQHTTGLSLIKHHLVASRHQPVVVTLTCPTHD